MYRFYYFGNGYDDSGWTYRDRDFDSLEEIYKFIETESWYADYRNNYKSTRSQFTPIRITQIIETTIIDASMHNFNGYFDKYISSGKIKFEEAKAKDDEDKAKKIKENELKLLEELKKKYESTTCIIPAPINIVTKIEDL